MDSIIFNPRLGIQSDDPVRQAVNAPPGDFSVGLWYNLLVESNITRAEKMNNKEKIINLPDKCPHCEQKTCTLTPKGIFCSTCNCLILPLSKKGAWYRKAIQTGEYKELLDDEKRQLQSKYLPADPVKKCQNRKKGE